MNTSEQFEYKLEDKYVWIKNMILFISTNCNFANKFCRS